MCGFFPLKNWMERRGKKPEGKARGGDERGE
jgi:hypothetical protein